jgi:Flp pilus assembly protein TadG
MQLNPRQPQRRGASTVELAVVCSATLFLIFAMIVGGSGVFRYQEVAHLAREGCRYAATHGGQYQQDIKSGTISTTVSQVISSSDVQAYLLPKTAALDPSKLTITASWSTGPGSSPPPSNITPINMPTYMNTNPNAIPPGQTTLQNYVTITVSYQWFPELYLVGPITLTSTATMPMSY